MQINYGNFSCKHHKIFLFGFLLRISMHESCNVTAQMCKTAYSKISLKHHKIGEKHCECFSRHLIFCKILICAHSKHSISRVSNCVPQIYMQEKHLLMLCGQLAISLLPFSLLYLPLLLCLSRISAAKRS